MKKWIKFFCIEVLQKMNKKYSQVLSYSIPEFNIDVQPDRCNNNSNELNSTVAKTSSKKSPMPTRKSTYTSYQTNAMSVWQIMDRLFPFLLWPKCEALSAGHANKEGKKRRSTTCRTDRANEANKMFIIWLC